MSFASNAFAERGAMRTETVESALVRQAGHSFLDAQFRRQRVRVALVKRLQLPQGSSVAGDDGQIEGIRRIDGPEVSLHRFWLGAGPRRVFESGHDIRRFSILFR